MHNDLATFMITLSLDSNWFFVRKDMLMHADATKRAVFLNAPA